MPLTHAVGRHLALAEAHQRLDLAGEAVAGGQHRQLAAQVLGLPVQHVAEQHGRLVVEVVAGDDDVVAAVDGGLVEQVALRQPARRARRPAWPPAPGRDVVAVLVGQVDLDELQPPLVGEGAGVVARTRRSSRRCRGRGRGRRPGSRARAGGPTRPASPCRPTPRRARGRRARACRTRRWPWPPGRGTAAGSARCRSWRCGAGCR